MVHEYMVCRFLRNWLTQFWNDKSERHKSAGWKEIWKRTDVAVLNPKVRISILLAEEEEICSVWVGEPQSSLSSPSTIR